jgi:serine/threonine-protein kinase
VDTERWDHDHWEQLERLFWEALERDAAVRSDFLDAACAGRPTLRREVDAMLAAHEHELGIEERLFEPHAPDEADEADVPMDGRVGPYRLLQPIGRGGMGDVYLAERADEQFHKQVALKVVKRGMDTDEILRRFRSERQILASLDHSGIARLLDGGMTDDGRPYFVLEYVEDGIPLTDYCDQQQLAITERLDLFRSVCATVQYAHQNLVVHRDLKPSNILVSADGTVKLLDFGIAKLLNPDLAPFTLAQTATAMRLMTPEYAAPEQVRGEAITTATDVYQLGVLLYELLTGHRPYHLARRTVDEVARVIREDEPTKPSTRVRRSEDVLSRQGEPETITPEQISRARGTDVDRLARHLRGDLDTIVLKALHKEPQRRYASVEALAGDVERYLTGLPITARPDTLGYRARTFVRRHRVAVTAATAVVLLVLVFGIVMAVQAVRIARQADEIARQRDAATEVASFLTGIFEMADPTTSRGEQVTARELLDQGAARIETDLAAQPAVQGQMMQTIGEVYLHLAQYDQADSLLRRSLDVRQSLFGPTHAEVAEALVARGDLAFHLSDLDRADSLLSLGLAMQRDVLGPEHPATALTMSRLGEVRTTAGQLDAAEVLHRDALAGLHAHYDSTHADVALAMNRLASTLRHADRYDEAEVLLRDALALRRDLYGQRHTAVAASMNSLAALLREQGRYDEAEALFRETLALKRALYGDVHPEVAGTLNSLAGVVKDRGDYAAATTLYDSTLAISRVVYGNESATTAQHMNNLATAYIYQGDMAESRRLLDEALPLAERALGEVSPVVAHMRNNLSYVLGELGDLAGAERELRRVLAIETSMYGEEHTEVAMTTASLSTLVWDQGRGAEARRLARTALALRRTLLPEEHPDLANSLYGVGTMVVDQDPAEAEGLFREALSIRRTAYAEDDVRVVLAEGRLGDTLRRLGRYDDAETLLLDSFEKARTSQGPDHWLTQIQVEYLAALYAAMNRPDEAATYRALLAAADG